MSDDKLVVLNNAPAELALQSGGIGIGSSLFTNLRPAFLEIVQTSSKQEGVTPGKFRDTSTNVHFDEMKWVFLEEPIEQREYYADKKNFSKDSKKCFSIDNIQPHPKAKDPQAQVCATCVMGDINWKKWEKTRRSEDIPPCSKYWKLFLAARDTQMPYIYNVKRTAIKPFEFSMQQLGRVFKQAILNTNAENRQLAAKGEPLKPQPNIFDFVFTVYTYQAEKGGPYMLGIKDIKAMGEEGKKDFGQIYLNYVQSRKEYNDAAVEAEIAAPEVVSASVPSPTDTQQEVEAVTGKPTITPKDGKEPITI